VLEIFITCGRQRELYGFSHALAIREALAYEGWRFALACP
jgi:hypothetical protein